MKHVPGSARTFLLAALAAAALVLAGSAAILAISGRGGTVPSRQSAPDDEEDDEDTEEHVVGADGPSPRHGGKSRTAKEADGVDDSEIGIPGETREPFGDDIPPVTPERLREVFAARHWEEIRRMIDVLQAEGKQVPQDVVRDLVAMLGKEDLRLDAADALGQVKDDATGRLLAELASSPEADAASRMAALDALAKSGQRSTMPFLDRLVADPSLDPKILRHALFAVAGIGGPDASKTLVEFLAQHSNGSDDLRDAIVSAIGSAKDVDQGLAAASRSARAKGDRDAMMAIMTATLLQRENAGQEVKGELLQVLEGAEALSAFTNEEQRELVRLAAMPPAVAAGIVEPVLRTAVTAGPGAARDNALNALRQARGDAAAKLIAAEIARAADENVRRELTVALGSTGSFQATATLVRLLDDPSAGVRHAAAYGLGQIRDAAAVKAILAHLPKAPPDDVFGQNLVVALGTIGANESLATLEKYAASKEDFWRQLLPRIQNAIVRIKTGNPDSQRIK